MMQSIRHGRYYLKVGCEHTAWLLSPTLDVNSVFLWGLVIVMARGVGHGCYYLKKECEPMARPLSPNVDQELETSLGTW